MFTRRYFVNSFQYRLMLGNLLYLSTAVLVFLAAVFGPVILTMGDTTLLPEQRESASLQLIVLYERLWFALPVLLGLCVLHSGLLSHRIAGPLHRFKRILQEMGNGDLTMRVRIRKSDYLHDEAQILDAMIERLRGRIAEIDQCYRDAARTLPRLMGAMEQGSPREAAVLAGELASRLDEVGRRIAGFQVRRIPVSDTRPAEVERIPVAAGR
jgi:methyl-accepting chemotaxis protein